MPIDETANYVRIMVANSNKFTKMRVKTLGKGIKGIVGFMKDGSSEIQSFLFPRKQYTLVQAKAWIKSHDYTVSESYLVNDINVGVNYLDFEETLITPEIENELLVTEKIDVTTIKTETWEWMFS